MKKRHYSTSSVILELSSPDILTSLTLINEAGIPLLHVKRVDEVTCAIEIQKRHLRDVRRLSEKHGDTVRVCNTSLSDQLGSGIKAHLISVAVLLLLLLITLYVPSRILFIRVVGNSQVPANTIIASAEKCGLSLGIRRRDVRSEKIKNQLLEDIPQLQWAGINTAGCVAVIYVQERYDQDQNAENIQLSNIIASSDGYILSGTAINGTALFSEGQSVRKGEVLISAYTDCGRYVQAVRAEGEIFAQTSQKITVVTPDTYGHKSEHGRVRKKYSLLLGKKRINLWKDSGISDITCGRIYEEYSLRLPGGFVLPTALCVDTYTYASIEEQSLNERDEIIKLKHYAQECLLGQMIAGHIIHEDYGVEKQDGAYMFSGDYVCHEMIGREQKIEFGDIDGKIS